MNPESWMVITQVMGCNGSSAHSTLHPAPWTLNPEPWTVITQVMGCSASGGLLALYGKQLSGVWQGGEDSRRGRGGWGEAEREYACMHVCNSWLPSSAVPDQYGYLIPINNIFSLEKLTWAVTLKRGNPEP